MGEYQSVTFDGFSLRLVGCFDEADKVVKEVFGVIGARSSFGVVLHRKDRVFCGASPFDSLVVEIDVGDLGIRREIVAVGSEAMVLSCDVDFARAKVFYRLIAASMTELQFVRFSAASVGEKLMAKANSEEGGVANELANLGVHIVEGLSLIHI